jgi:hypothetical protein
MIETHLSHIAHALVAIAKKQDPEYKTAHEAEREQRRGKPHP